MTQIREAININQQQLSCHIHYMFVPLSYNQKALAKFPFTHWALAIITVSKLDKEPDKELDKELDKLLDEKYCLKGLKTPEAADYHTPDEQI